MGPEALAAPLLPGTAAAFAAAFALAFALGKATGTAPVNKQSLAVLARAGKIEANWSLVGFSEEIAGGQDTPKTSSTCGRSRACVPMRPDS